MQYLQPTDLATAYTDAQTTARKQWKKYDECERLEANEVRSDLPLNMPKVNDGSLSATLDKIPKRAFAKPMTGSIKAVDRDEDWVGLLVTIILEKKIIPNANTDASFLRKWKQAIKKAKTYGSQPIYTFLTQHGTYIGADLSLPYVKNVYLEPGKVSDLASDYIFMDSYYTKLQLRRLIDQAVEEETAAAEAGETYEGIWDSQLLQEVYDAGPNGKDSQSRTQPERAGENTGDKVPYKLVTCFNRGYQAPFYTFAPNLSNKVVGTQYNTNPTGDLPIIYLYHEEDGVHPYGVGLVQKSGSTQNVLDNLTQTDVLQTQIGSQPPINVHGDRSQTQLKSFVYAPAQFWFTGNAEVTPVKAVDPSMYNALPGRVGMYKSQLQFMTGTFDNSVSSESGQPGFSKTDAGVNALQNQTNADDNDTQQSIADAYTRVVKSMVNIHMNNMEGTDLIKLEGDEIDRLAKTDLIPTDPQTGEALTTEIEVVWDNLRGTFEFEVDPESSMLKDEQSNAKVLSDAITTYVSNPEAAQAMQMSGWKFDLGEAYAQVFAQSGIKNVEKILVKITPEQQAEMQQAQAMQSGVDPTTGQPLAQAPPTEQATSQVEQPQQLPPEQDIMGRISSIQEQYNVDQDTAAAIAAAEDHGATPDQIPQLLNYMQGAMNG